MKYFIFALIITTIGIGISLYIIGREIKGRERKIRQ